jgi:hypothetical protein
MRVFHPLRRVSRASAALVCASALVLAACGGSAPSLLPLAPSSNVASDAFTRTTTSGWGTADVGGNYQMVGAAGGATVANGAGHFTFTAPGGRGALLPSTSARSVSVAATIATNRLATSSCLCAYLVGRAQQNGEYRGMVRFAPDGNVYATILRADANGAETVLFRDAATGIVHRAGVAVRARLQVTGTGPVHLAMRVWPASDGEPATWHAQANDTSTLLTGPGAIGVRAYVNAATASAPVTIDVDGLDAADLDVEPPPADPVETAGALAPGKIAYAVPAGALFVAKTGNDAHAGTKAAPFKTVARAIAVAPDGATIVVRAGTYHESAQVFRKRLTLQPFPKEKVIFDGAAKIGGFVADGTRWRKSNFQSVAPRDPDPIYVDDNPQATWPDQVFIDGVAQREVGSLAQLGRGDFFVDPGTRQLYVGSSPVNHKVEASTLADALFVNEGNGTIVRGFTFRRYGTPIDEVAAVKGFANDVVFENNVFSDNAATGLALRGNDVVARANTASRNGQLGIVADRSTELVVEDSLLAGNNTERFALESAEGGVKLTRVRASAVRDNIVEGNHGRGIWFDIESYDNEIVRNVVRYNDSDGIEYEISAAAVIGANTVHDNARRAIYVLESSNVDVYNNTLVRNENAIYVLDGGRTSTDPLIPKDVHDVVVRNNLLAGATPDAVTMINVDDALKRRSAAAMGVSADYDGYYRQNKATPDWVAGWSNWPSGHQVFTTVSAFSTATGQERRSIAIDSAVDPLFIDSNANDFRLRSSAPALDKGAPLPANVAAALGQPTGTVLDLGAPAG